MAETQFTPGPWEAEADRGDLHILGSDYVGGSQTIATVYQRGNGHDCEAVQGANACLIAAAPDLFAALEEAVGWFEQYAKDHYAKALTAPDGGEQHSREVKGKINRDRANQLRAIVTKALGK